VADYTRPAFRYFISAADGDGEADGTAERPFNSLGSVLRILLENHQAEPERKGTLGTGETIEIVYAAAADGPARRRGRQWTYYFSPETATDQGEGSEVLPWQAH
jgi:hypothetical protein